MKNFSGYIDFNGILTTDRIYNNQNPKARAQEPHGEEEMCEELMELLKTNRKDKRIPTTIELYPEYTDGDGNWKNMEYKNMKKTLLDEDIEIFVKYEDEETIGNDEDKIWPDIIWYSTKIPLRYLVFLYYYIFIHNSTKHIYKSEWAKKQKHELIQILETHQKSTQEDSYINHSLPTILIGPSGMYVTDVGG